MADLKKFTAGKLLAQLEAERRTWLLDLLAAGKAAHKIRSRLPALAGRLPPAGEGR